MEREQELIKRYPSVLILVKKLGKDSVSLGWLVGRGVSLAHAACIVALYWGSKVGRVGGRGRLSRRTEKDGLALLNDIREAGGHFVECGNCVYDGQSVWVWEKGVSPQAEPPKERLWIDEWQD